MPPKTMANFYGMITNIDENLGRFRARLDELGLTENTLLIFMTDNGTTAGWIDRQFGLQVLQRGYAGLEGVAVGRRTSRAVLLLLARLAD